MSLMRAQTVNYIDDNVLINQFLAPLEVGHEVDTVAKVHSFVNLCAEIIKQSMGARIPWNLSLGSLKV